MSSSLFGNRIHPACQYCIRMMRAIPRKEQVICEKFGVVAADYSCSKYRYDPLRRVPRRPRPLQRFSAEDFSIDDLHTEEANEINETTSKP